MSWPETASDVSCAGLTRSILECGWHRVQTSADSASNSPAHAAQARTLPRTSETGFAFMTAIIARGRKER